MEGATRDPHHVCVAQTPQMGNQKATTPEAGPFQHMHVAIAKTQKVIMNPLSLLLLGGGAVGGHICALAARRLVVQSQTG